MARTESRQETTGADTERRENPEAGPMRKTPTGRKKAASTSKAKASTRAKKPTRPASVPTKKTTAAKAPKKAKKINSAKAKAPVRAKKSPAKVKKTGRAALRFNPESSEALAKVWKAWTGSEPGKVFEVEVDDAARHKLPAKVVLLGRLSWLATQDGEEKRFGEKGPLMVTDGEARRVWLVSSTAHRFDLEPSIIAYLARKPKFGDKDLVEYVHAFEGRAHAVMNGQVGALTGTFRITPAGLEG